MEEFRFISPPRHSETLIVFWPHPDRVPGWRDPRRNDVEGWSSLVFKNRFKLSGSHMLMW